MASTGWLAPSTATGSGWTNASNATARDDVETSTLSAPSVLTLSGYDFSAIADADTVDGVEVRWRKRGTNFFDVIFVKDTTVRFTNTNQGDSANKADTTTNWPDTIHDITYGSPTDIWGWTTPTGTDFKDASFNVEVQTDATANTPAYTDVVEINVHYTIEDAGGEKALEATVNAVSSVTSDITIVKPPSDNVANTKFVGTVTTPDDDVFAVETPSWTNADNIKADDGNYATFTVDVTNESGSKRIDSLIATNFNFNIPSVATITGYQLEYEGNTTNTNTFYVFNTFGDLFLRHNNADIGIDKGSASSDYLPTTDTVKTFGDNEDLWGTSLTVNQVNDSSFGVRLQYVANANGTGVQTLNIDYLKLTVFYDLPAFNAEINAVSNVTSNLSLDRLFDANTNISSSSTAALSVQTEQTFAANVNAVSNVTSSTVLDKTFDSNTNAVSNVTSSTVLDKTFNSNTNALSSINVPNIVFDKNFNSDISLTSNATSAITISGSIWFDAQVNAVLNASSDLRKSGNILFNADVNALTSTASDIILDKTFNSNVNALTTTTSDVILDKTFNSNVNALTSTASDIVLDKTFNSDVNALSSTSVQSIVFDKNFNSNTNILSDIDVLMDKYRLFEATVNALSGVSVTSLLFEKNFNANTNITTSVTSNNVLDRGFNATVNTVSDITSDINKTGTILLAANVASTGNIEVNPEIDKTFITDVTISSTTDATLMREYLLTSNINISSDVSVDDAILDKGFAVDVDISSSAIALPGITQVHAATVNITSDIQSRISGDVQLSAEVDSASSIIASLIRDIELDFLNINTIENVYNTDTDGNVIFATKEESSTVQFLDRTVLSLPKT